MNDLTYLVELSVVKSFSNIRQNIILSVKRMLCVHGSDWVHISYALFRLNRTHKN